MAAPVTSGRGARARDRLARLRRERRRAAGRLRRLRAARAAGRPRARARDEGEAQPRRGDSRSRCSSRARSGSRRRARTSRRCGGCRFQDLAYEAQLAAEGRSRSRDALAPDRRDRRAAARADRPGASRSSTTATSSSTRSRRRRTGPALGFHRAGRWDEVLEIERCWLTTDLGNAIRDAVRDWAREERLEAYDQAEHTGYLRHLVVREGRNTGQVLVQLVTAPGERFDRDELRRGAARASPRCARSTGRSTTSPAEVTNLPTTLLWGEDAIEEELCGLRFRVRPNAFLQTNTAMAERLYELAGEYAGLTGNETVYDLYCGIGTIGLTLASRRADGVGRRDLGGVGRLRARERRPERDRERGLLRRRRRRGRSRSCTSAPGAPDVVVVDPPRAGLSGKALRRARRARARRGSSTSPATRRRSPANVKELARGVGLHARARAAGGHVPAHAARRGGRAAATSAG